MTANVSRWSDNIPNEEAEFGTPIAASAPPQYNTVRLYFILYNKDMHLFFCRNDLL